MLFASCAYYLVYYQADPPLVRGVARRPLSVAEFTEAAEMLLLAATRYRCPFWLLDGRADEDTRPPAVYAWLVDEFLPGAHQTLGLIPCLAFIARPEFWYALRERHQAPPVPMLFSAAFRANWFVAEDEAVTWLAQFRPAIGLGADSVRQQ